MIVLWETWPHYGRHLLPIAAELARRGVGYQYVKAPDVPVPDPDAVLVAAAYRDLIRQRRHWRARVLVEHGVGQSYRGGGRGRTHHAYSNGNRDPYDLLLSPGPACRDAAAREVVDVGLLPRAWRAVVPDLVAFAWHWPCHVSPEAGTARHAYRHVLDQRDRVCDLDVLQHKHPRWLRSPGDWPDTTNLVVERAAVLVADNTSLMFELAAYDVPIVVVNDPSWRRTVEHGKRFWEWADVGEQVNHPVELWPVTERALVLDPQRERRREVASLAYAAVPDSASSAVDAILGLL